MATNAWKSAVLPDGLQRIVHYTVSKYQDID